jgi:ABC-type lipoprotein export system ATPase subunit
MMIEAENLTKSYRKGATLMPVLKGVTLRVVAGEFVAVMGRSGSGKSTLLNILGLLDRPDGGCYRLDGVDFSAADDNTLSAARNRKIGFVFQQFHLLERASALRNVSLPLLYAEDQPDDDMERARQALDSVGLSHRLRHLPSELSGGEQQRVAIARALVNRPSLILADEPTGNLDAQAEREVLDIFRRLAGAGRTLVLVTHSSTVAAHADRTLVIEDGSIASQGGNPAAPQGYEASIHSSL